jgi:predicted membrane protein
MSDSNNPADPRIPRGAEHDIRRAEHEMRRAEKAMRRAARHDWRGCSGVFTGGPSPAGRLFFAVALIAAGVILFLDNLGLLRLRDIWEYSPLLASAFGVSMLSEARTNSKRYWGFVLVVFGVLGTLINLGVLRIHTRDDSWLLALLLIAVGVFALLRTVEGGAVAATKTAFEFPPQRETSPLADNLLNEHAVFGSVKRRVETPNFLGGEIECAFGNVELDLRYSQIVPNGMPVIVHVNCVFGATKMRIPDSWGVTVQAAGVFGNVEDRTIPPRSSSGLIAPTLLITGQSVFSSVEIEN